MARKTVQTKARFSGLRKGSIRDHGSQLSTVPSTLRPKKLYDRWAACLPEPIQRNSLLITDKQGGYQF